MKHPLLSITALAVIALTAQVFAADKPTGADTKTRPGLADMPALAKPPAQSQTPSQPNKPPPPPPAPVTTPKITTAKYSLLEVNALDPVSLKLDGVNLGAGMDCAGKVVWGDGTTFDNTLGVNGQWRTLTKTFTKQGNYTATVTPKSYSGSACISDAPINVSIKVNPPTPLPPSKMTKLVVSPLPNIKARLISTKWDGGGNPKAKCAYTLHFGDGTSTQTGAGPIQPGSDETHVYPTAGTYSVIITPSNSDYDSCSLGPDAGPKTFTVE